MNLEEECGKLLDVYNAKLSNHSDITQLEYDIIIFLEEC